MRIARCLLVLCGAACAGDGRVPMNVAVDVEGAVPVTGATLEGAEASIEGLTFRRDPALAARRAPSLPDVVIDAIVPTAHAHPGHDDGTDLVGEWIGEADVDLLAGASLGTATLLSGEVGLVDVALGEVSLTGTLTVDGSPHAFDWTIDVDAGVLGLPMVLDLDPEAPPTAIAITFVPDAVLEAMSEVAPPEADPWTLADAADRNTLAFALRQRDAWRVEVRP